MKSRNPFVFSLRLGLPIALSLALLTVGCGGDDDKDPADAGAADVVVDAGADAGTADTGSGSQDTGSGSADTGSGAQDTGPAVKTTCSDALLCQTACGKGDQKCVDGCAADVSAADKTNLGDIATCAVDLCKDVTEGTAAEQECAFNKCYDKYEACSDFGSGANDCTATVACLASCKLTDFGCRLTCMNKADKAALGSAKATAVCVATKCKGISDQGKLGACVAKECSSEIGACLAGAKFGCTDINVWVSKCVKTSALEPNNCLGIITGLADEAGRNAYDAYGVCKEQCLQSVNIIGCWGEKCSTEAKACFESSGTKNCQDIDKCVIASCDGIGGDIACVKKCLPASKPASQDAYLAYEGCMIRNMNTKEAKTAKCKFPYDQATCIPIIKGQFCGNESQSCFTDQ